ncbi:hypothetical protein ABI59_04945 [Acidobacteria bacterium Mor1]|nr:hypothetical protein ABI59_04945 [Acidobacteria bacterium Mor1]
MPLIGTLSTMALPDLLQWLGQARQSGTLHVERHKVVKRILFEEGRVIGCSSDDPPEKLGQFLLSRGKITDQQLRMSLTVQESDKRHLGTILVEMGALSEEDLSSHLAAKAEEIIYSVFVWEDAVFRFEETLTDIQNVFPTSLQVEDILLRGLKRWDEMQQIREVIHDQGIVLQRKSDRTPPEQVVRNRMARKIYEAIDGKRTVAEILLLTHGSEYVVLKFLFELVRNGFCENIGIRETPPPSPPATPAAEPAAAQPEPQAETPGAEAPEAAAGDTAVAVAPPPPVAAADASPVGVPGEVAQAPGAQDAEETELGSARLLMSKGEFDQALQILDGLYRARPQDGNLRKLVAEAETAFVEKAYRHYLPAEQIPVLTRPIEELQSDQLSPSEYFLLSRIDGTWDIKSIIQIAPIREVDALRTLRRMREEGIIELRNADGS